MVKHTQTIHRILRQLPLKGLSLSSNTILHASCFSLLNFYRSKQQTTSSHPYLSETTWDHPQPSTTNSKPPNLKWFFCVLYPHLVGNLSNLYTLEKWCSDLTIINLTFREPNFSSIELLRIHLDDNLNVDLQVSSMYSTAVNQVRTFRRSWKFVIFNAKKVFMKSYIVLNCNH